MTFPPQSNTLDFASYQRLLAQHPDLISQTDSITRRINAERVLIVGWPRAILMQIAHPMVAQGVADHSEFSDSIRSKLGRFWRTLDQMLRLTFGTPEQIWKAAQSIDRIHARVYGEREQQRYAARDVALLKWVHCTFIDAMIETYGIFVRPLTDAEKEEYVYKASVIAPLLGAPHEVVPHTYADLQAYLQTMFADQTLIVDRQTQTLARYVLTGVPIPVLQPLIEWYLRVSTGLLLPESLRAAYGLEVGRFGRSMFMISAGISRIAHRILPNFVRHWRF
ncbi:MAG: DUF2236 domain-containing protein [Anaerolineae bacterium]|jgi:uncharacterized protein (DUF2236 family)|nr:DUF2236 domain-containing protein [Anaerolineae bacterium]